MKYRTIVKPEVYGCELQYLKDQLRYTGSEMDQYLTNLIIAATAQANDFTGRQLNRAVMLAFTSYKPGTLIYEIHRGPVVSVDVIRIQHADGTSSVLSSSEYYLIIEELSCYVVLKSSASLAGIDLERADAIGIEYTAGFNWTEPSKFPEDIVSAIAMIASRAWQNPDDAVDEKTSLSETLLKKYRCPII